MSNIETISELRTKHKSELCTLKSKHEKELAELCQVRFKNGLDGIEKGDILYDHYQCIKVETCALGYYAGLRLIKSTRKPYKNAEIGRVYIKNIKKVVK